MGLLFMVSLPVTTANDMTMMDVCVLAEAGEDEVDDEVHELLTLLRARGLQCCVRNAWTEEHGALARLSPRIILNLARPCAHLRDRPSRLQEVLGRLYDLEDDGTTIINGAPALELGATRLNQFRVMRQLHMAHPRVLLFRSVDALRLRLGSFPFPAVVRTNPCSLDSNAQQVRSVDDLDAYVEQHPSFRADGCVLQPQLPPAVLRDGILRMVFARDQLLFAHRIHPSHATNNDSERIQPACLPILPPTQHMAFRSEILHETDLPREAVSCARRVIQCTGVDVASVECCIVPATLAPELRAVATVPPSSLSSLSSSATLSSSTDHILFCDMQAVSRLRLPPGLDAHAVLGTLADFVTLVSGNLQHHHQQHQPRNRQKQVSLPALPSSHQTTGQRRAGQLPLFQKTSQTLTIATESPHIVGLAETPHTASTTQQAKKQVVRGSVAANQQPPHTTQHSCGGGGARDWIGRLLRYRQLQRHLPSFGTFNARAHDDDNSDDVKVHLLNPTILRALCKNVSA
ncbi:hypothetical protein PTSG_04596 [Salpingoeca rosetta]|uniref:ATP-grasp domain-containing protein n=1 Tax=Salpingoeca rosetta (strain ATCC 50818 / BSB-021) TaxID=946362 RepID=F2U7W2_SALR5|nr:uncharacterized protein PTSG_04596 [Salpingoeca rosetta]EGD72867.1 hypothetical protein PTSG_04596 [Salpingoeca rosetta]|eukprot:XP_004994690.1 hypothetical protein PTSG_04596 [Salpingoeca rosetta]